MAVDDGKTPLRTVWPATTHFTPLRAAASHTLLEVRIETGVTHQIRVHLAHLGHPIVGDRRYGGEEAPRLALHASVLAFEHPATGQPLQVESRLGESVARLLGAEAQSPHGT